MADENKKPDDQGFNVIEWAIILIFSVTILRTAIPTAFKNLVSGKLSFYGFKLSGLFEFLASNVLFFKILGFVLAGAAAVGTIIFTKKADAIWRLEKTEVYPKTTEEPPPNLPGAEVAENPVVEKWERIIKLAESQNQSDWRLSIIEADIILDDLLMKLQLPGATMGEKLEAVEKSDFTTIESAWEAHKFRNSIAHEGNDFLVNQREIHRIISLYEAVFKEFYLV